MALDLQVTIQGNGGRLVTGLQVLQVYFIFLRCPSLTTATGSSLNGSLGSWVTSNTVCGHTLTHSPQPLHLSVSIDINHSPDPSLYP